MYMHKDKRGNKPSSLHVSRMQRDQALITIHLYSVPHLEMPMTNEWLDEWMGGWVVIWVDVWVDAMDGWVGGYMGGWMGG